MTRAETAAYNRALDDAIKAAEAVELRPKNNDACADQDQLCAFNMGREQMAIVLAIQKLKRTKP